MPGPGSAHVRLPGGHSHCQQPPAKRPGLCCLPQRWVPSQSVWHFCQKMPVPIPSGGKAQRGSHAGSMEIFPGAPQVPTRSIWALWVPSLYPHHRTFIKTKFIPENLRLGSWIVMGHLDTNYIQFALNIENCTALLIILVAKQELGGLSRSVSF